MERPIPYRGEDGYIFISYAHRDSERVWPIISRMQADGFRVWYDDGIDPGTEWDENIASHVARCGYFIAFLSENYLNSDNCKDELNFSRDQGKPQLLIYLEDVELPSGMAMRLGRNQAIFQSQYEEEVFFEKLYEAQDLHFFRGSNQAPEIKSAAKLTSKTFQMKKKVSVWPIVAAVLLIAVAVAVFLWPKAEAPEKVPQPSTEAITEATGPEMKKVTNEVLADTGEMKIVALDTSLDSRYFMLTLSVTNKGSTTLELHHENFYLNGVLCEPTWYGSAPAGEAVLMELHWERSIMEDYGIDPEAVTMIEGELYGNFTDNSGEIEAHSITYYPYGEENKTLLTYTPDEDDVVLLDTRDYVIAARDSWIDESSGNWVLDLVCINRGQERASLSVENEQINNCYGGRSIWWCHVAAGHIAYKQLCFLPEDWKPAGYDQVLCYRGEWTTGEDARYPFVYYPKGEAAAAAIPVPRQLTEEEFLFENEYVRVGYLGCYIYRDIPSDVIYVCNLNNVEQEIKVSLFAGENIGYGCWMMAPGEEAVVTCYRRGSAVGETMTADFYWEFPGEHIQSKTVEVKLRDLEE